MKIRGFVASAVIAGLLWGMPVLAHAGQWHPGSGDYDQHHQWHSGIGGRNTTQIGCANIITIGSKN
jgi:hypothetical protein